MILSKKNIVAGFVITALLSATLAFAYKKGQEDRQADWDKYALEQAQEYIKKAQEAAQKQAALQSKVNEIRGRYESEKELLHGTISDLNNRLRDRPERPSDNDRMPEAPATEQNTQGCTGKQLFREDAEVLVRESERADRMRLLLIECRSAYDSLREKRTKNN